MARLARPRVCVLRWCDADGAVICFPYQGRKALAEVQAHLRLGEAQASQRMWAELTYGSPNPDGTWPEASGAEGAR